MPLLLADRAVLLSPIPLLTTRESRMLGIPLSPRTMIRVRSGVYVDRQTYLKLPPWSKYAVRVHAFALKHPDAVLAFESAAVLHGLPQFGETRDIHVFDPERSRSRRFGDVVVHTSNSPREIDEMHGLLVTGMLDTVVDLARVLPPALSLAVTDASISPVQGGTLSAAELRQRAESQDNSRGRARMSWLWARADGRAESPAESISRAVIEWCGFEEPELQREFRYEGMLDRTDFFFASTKTIGEADGWQKYELSDPANAVRRLSDEKRREDRLRRHGHPFARWELFHVWRVTPLARTLVAARVKQVAPRQQQMLATLRQNKREIQPAHRGEKPSRA